MNQIAHRPNSFDHLMIQTPLDIARTNRSKFTDEFIAWLTDNLHVYRAFEAEAFNVIQKGFKHYSSKTIIEFMRHHSAMRQTPFDWKLNNNMTPYLPRLFDLVNPQHVGLWEYRETKKISFGNEGWLS